MGITGFLKKLFAGPYTKIRPAQVAELLERGAILIDVREADEWRVGHAPKARHIPLGQLAGRAREIPAGRVVVTVCRSGMRSARAARLLAGQGREVFNISGGMSAWAREGLPVVANGGRVGRIG